MRLSLWLFISGQISYYHIVTEKGKEAVCTQMDMEMSTSSQQKKFSRVQMETSLSPQIHIIINKLITLSQYDRH